MLPTRVDSPLLTLMFHRTVFQPVMSIIFGNLTNTFVKFGQEVANGTQADINTAAANFRHSADKDAAILVYIGLGILGCTFTYMYSWVYTGEMSSKRVREKYLQAVLRQDIAFFDNVGAGEIATRIQTDTRKYLILKRCR